MNTHAPVLPDTDPSADAPIAGIGDNNPPLGFDQDGLDKVVFNFNAFMNANKVWMDLKVIKTQDQADKASDMLAGFRGLWKATDDERKKQKKPIDDLGKIVQAKFAPYLKKAKTGGDNLKPMIADWLTKQQAIADEKKRKEANEAAEKQRQAEAALAEAEKDNDLSAQVEAEEELKASAKALKAAAKPAKVKTGSATGAGRTVSLRKVRTAEITSDMKLFLHYRDNPAVTEVLLSLANADIRNTEVDETKIPGITIVEKPVAA